MSPLENHARRMADGPPTLDREVARDYLLNKSDELRALVVYDFPDSGVMVYEIQPDAGTLANLMSCHNKYLGVNKLADQFATFIREFPDRFESNKIIDSTDHQGTWRGMTHPISFMFLIGSYEKCSDKSSENSGQSSSSLAS